MKYDRLAIPPVLVRLPGSDTATAIPPVKLDGGLRCT